MRNTKKSKVLIIHGWLHSSKRYAELGAKLSKYADVDIYEFAGFGDTKYTSVKLDILNNYVEKLNNYLMIDCQDKCNTFIKLLKKLT